MTIQKSELEDLQAKIRETENRLRTQQGLPNTNEGSRRTPGSPSVARKPALETISSTDSEDDSDTPASDSEDEEAIAKDSFSDPAESSQEESDSTKDSAVQSATTPTPLRSSQQSRQRAASQSSPPAKTSKPTAHSSSKRPSTVSAHRKSVSRTKV